MSRSTSSSLTSSRLVSPRFTSPRTAPLRAHTHPQEWLDWDDVQKTRLTCLERLEAATTPTKTHSLLQDALMISLFSVTPPDVSASPFIGWLSTGDPHLSCLGIGDCECEYAHSPIRGFHGHPKPPTLLLPCAQRVGVIRRLMVGVTLRRIADSEDEAEGAEDGSEGAWWIDLTQAKHKTSRF